MSDEGRPPDGQSPVMPSVVLSLKVGSSSLRAAVRDPRLRMQVAATELDGDSGRLTVSGGGSAEHHPVPGGWEGAGGQIAAGRIDRPGTVRGPGARERVIET